MRRREHWQAEQMAFEAKSRKLTNLRCLLYVNAAIGKEIVNNFGPAFRNR
jgi:hypothetical protein